MRPADTEILSSVLDDLDDTTGPITMLTDAISCAECSETLADLRANLADAIGAAEDLIKTLRALAKHAKSGVAE